MTALERPQLRPFLAAAPDDYDPRYVVIWDRSGLSRAHCRVTVREFVWLQLFDGKRTLREIQCEVMRQGDGQLLPLDAFTALAEKMDGAFFLDGPRFRQLLAGPVREPSCIGCYEAEPDALRRQLAGLFTGPGGPACPPAGRPTAPSARPWCRTSTTAAAAPPTPGASRRWPSTPTPACL